MMLIILGLGCLIASVLIALSIIRDFVSEKTKAIVLKNYVERSTSSRGIKRKEHFADIRYTHEGKMFESKIFQKSRKKVGETVHVICKKNSVSEFYPMKDFVYFTVSLVIGLITLTIILNS